jgi:hypothetical protein
MLGENKITGEQKHRAYHYREQEEVYPTPHAKARGNRAQKSKKNRTPIQAPPRSVW